MTTLKELWNYCRTCKRRTDHLELKKERVNHFDAPVHYNYMIISCKGCKTISYRSETVEEDEQEYDDNGYLVPKIRFHNYPAVLEGHTRLENGYLLPQDIAKIYFETINAMVAKCNVLAALGMRTIVEAVCINHELKARTLETSIKLMLKNGLITKKEYKRLHAIRFMGNDAAHQIRSVSEKDLRIVLNLIEHLLLNLYLIDVDASTRFKTVITDLPELLKLLNAVLPQFEIDRKADLETILGKEYHRLDDQKELEQQLMESIAEGSYKKLDLAEVAKDAKNKAVQQYFVRDNSPEYDF